MMRKTKKTDLASKSGENTPERALLPRGTSDWFAEMDRWFDDLRNEFERTFWGPDARYGREGVLAARQPLVDLADNGREFVLTAELPGVKKEDLDIQVTPEGIEIGAETQREREDNGKDYAYRERSYSSFRRVLPFPEEVLPDQVEAKLTDGVLEVRLPKKEPAPRREPVKVRVE
ncbi:MAG TPA: Hsp20/alpha crystallin family protein [Thermoplasmata archaeon]|nr:Hsp20/alpha crystallin family protein [Thermoplasmata archaeon]